MGKMRAEKLAKRESAKSSENILPQVMKGGTKSFFFFQIYSLEFQHYFPDIVSLILRSHAFFIPCALVGATVAA